MRPAPLAHPCPRLLGEPAREPPLAPAARRPSNSGQRHGQRHGTSLTDALVVSLNSRDGQIGNDGHHM